MTLLLALLLAHGAPDSPYHWHMSCTRWHEKTQEILADPHLDEPNKRFLIRYFRSKVDGSCDLA